MIHRRRRALLGAVVALALGATAACGSQLDRDQEEDALVVRTEHGPVLGQESETLRSWLGIPFAAPPVDELRWRPPQPPQQWSAVRETQEFTPLCLQGTETTLNPNSAEDCLYVNVMRPADDREDLPVMVWIHGGGLKTGSGTLPLEMAQGLVDQGIMLVSFNYRLGRLGYFAHPALEAEAVEKGEEPVANFGLLDQVAALEWLRENIGQFGGDRDQVTIFGISAGGASVNYLMSSPEAEGLFDRAIAQSGLGREVPMPWADALDDGESLAASLGVPDADAEALRKVPAEDVARLPALLLQNEIPIADPVLPRSVAATFADGQEADVPYIVGATDREMIPKYLRALGIDTATLSRALGADRQAEAVAAYDGDVDEFRRHFPSDVIFGEPARNLAVEHADDAPTYFYRFAITDPATQTRYGGALHGADYPFVFGFGSGAPKVERADELAREMSECWAAFAKGEEPACGGTPWPQVQDGGLMEFTNDGARTVSDDPWAERFDLVESIVDRLT